MNSRSTNTIQHAFPTHICLPEPYLAFHPERTSDRHKHPLQGLKEYGPYSRSLNYVADPIRVAMITPYGELSKIAKLFKELAASHSPRERRTYLPQFLGFPQIFGVRVVAADSDMRIQLRKELDDEMATVERPHILLAEELTKAAALLRGYRTQFDVLLVLLPTRWEHAFKGSTNEDFDLHDYLKAMLAGWGMPSQVIREDHALDYYCRCSVMWRLGIALYCKAGGIPWKLADHDPETAFVGLSYAVRMSEDQSPTFVTCCSQVFDADGAGLEFIAYDIGDSDSVDLENPFMSREQMRRVMARSLRLYQARHFGRNPKHVIIHKNTQFKDEEVDGCFDAWNDVESLDLIRVQTDTLWRGIKLESNSGQPRWRPGNYPVERGSLLRISTRDALLWTQGNVPDLTRDRNYYKEGKGIPSPLLLQRYAGHGEWEDSCHQILGLSKMDWNNDYLYNRLPVTLSYAKVLARTIKRMPSLSKQPYQFRLFM